jgi:hypothetical protein
MHQGCRQPAASLFVDYDKGGEPQFRAFGDGGHSTSRPCGSQARQMSVVHLATMTFTHRLACTETIQQQDSAQNALNKLMRTFTNQMETLKRYRSGAQQTVKVEHVHVHEGGQAIVGNVGPGGGAAKLQDQAHAQITHAPEPEMRSAVAEERETLSKRSDVER